MTNIRTARETGRTIVTLDAQTLFTELLPQARKVHKLDGWITTCRNFVNAQDQALRQTREALREQLGVRAELVKAQSDLDEVRQDRERLLDVLEQWIGHCPDCGGAGEIQETDDSARPCEFCAPAWKLFERLRPRPIPPAQPEAATEVDDDIAF